MSKVYYSAAFSIEVASDAQLNIPLFILPFQACKRNYGGSLQKKA